MLISGIDKDTPRNATISYVTTYRLNKLRNSIFVIFETTCRILNLKPRPSDRTLTKLPAGGKELDLFGLEKKDGCDSQS